MGFTSRFDQQVCRRSNDNYGYFGQANKIENTGPVFSSGTAGEVGEVDEDNDDDVEENTDDTATRLGWAAEHRPLVVLKCKIENSNLKLSLTPRKQILDGKSLGVCSKTRLVQNQLYLASKPNKSSVNA